MTNDQIQKARLVIKNKPYLMWSTKNYDELSPESVFENVINYGDWADFITIKEIFGIKQSSDLFNEIKRKRRSNLTPQTINYFTKYFNKYAQRDTF